MALFLATNMARYISDAAITIDTAAGTGKAMDIPWRNPGILNRKIQSDKVIKEVITVNMIELRVYPPLSYKMSTKKVGAHLIEENIHPGETLSKLLTRLNDSEKHGRKFSMLKHKKFGLLSWRF